jgi:hypothetical protein
MFQLRDFVAVTVVSKRVNVATPSGNEAAACLKSVLLVPNARSAVIYHAL